MRSAKRSSASQSQQQINDELYEPKIIEDNKASTSRQLNTNASSINKFERGI